MSIINTYSTIDTILLTEKGSLLQELNNDYVFKVHKKANKRQIKDAIEKVFDVKVENVRTMNCLGKKKRKRRADAGRTAHWKKAYVRLVEGDTIDLV